MGKPAPVMQGHPDISGSEPRELKHLSTSGRENKVISLVAASERERA